jgi:zinc protease
MMPNPENRKPFPRAQALMLALCAAAALAVAADKPPVAKIHTHQLVNGLKIVLIEDHSRPVTNLQVWYHVGSKDEKFGRTGFAHLFEHIMFRGSSNVEAEEHARIVKAAGGVVNAYTNFDTTVYWETFPSNYLDQMLWLEADRMASLKITEANFEKEREVVKEERRMRIETPPYGTLIEDLLKYTYQQYPYKHMPIGSMDDLNKATIADVKEFHDIFYVPNNATVVAVGDFDAKEAIGMIEKQFSKVPKGKPVPRVTVTEPSQSKLKEVTAKYKNIPLDAVVTAYHLPPIGDPDSYALEIASNILSAGQSSRIYKRLVYDEQSAAQAAGQAMFLEGPSIFFGYAIANQGKNIKEVGTSLEYTFNEMAGKPVTDEELSKAKNQMLAGFIIGREGVQSQADALGRCAVLLQDPERFNTEMEKYRQVTAADIQRVVKKYLTPDNETKIWVYPESAPKQN